MGGIVIALAVLAFALLVRWVHQREVRQAVRNERIRRRMA